MLVAQGVERRGDASAALDQLKAGLAMHRHHGRRAEESAHLDHIPENRLDPAARVLVDHDPAPLDAVIDAPRVRLDRRPPGIGPHKEPVLRAPVVAVPDQIQVFWVGG